SDLSKSHYKNFGDLKTGANNRELWSISSIDAVVNLGPENSSLCLGEAMELWVTATTAYDPEVEELEYHWSSDNSFKGRIQDIHDDPNNFGASIITKGKIVSYISAALESELGSGDNLETVTVTVYARNLQNGELTKVGEDSMQVNHQQKCSSFYVPFDRVVNIAEEENSLACSGNTMYNVQQAIYVAEFPAVENAVGYKARTLRKDGSYTELYDIRIGDNQSETIRFTMGVGGIYIFMTCNLAEAEEEQARRMDYLEEVGSQGIEVSPQFQ